MYLAFERSSGGGISGSQTEAALDELDRVYSFVLSRVGSRADAEDLTQQVALKALPRLRLEASIPEVRSYLYSTARSALATFWSERYRLPESELPDDATDPDRGQPAVASAEASAWLAETLAALPAHYRQVLELRFLRGCSIRETANEMGRTSGAVKVMQLRALRAASQSVSLPDQNRPARRPPAAARGSASVTPRVLQDVSAPR
ncbi:MAG TPA: RNA polymerase sigma factor [Candidatus Udaeobacter sp.]|nr:RNA polymerase sigma factor [Candidatus Udaeobacter sp.]